MPHLLKSGATLKIGRTNCNRHRLGTATRFGVSGEPTYFIRRLDEEEANGTLVPPLAFQVRRVNGVAGIRCLFAM